MARKRKTLWTFRTRLVAGLLVVGAVLAGVGAAVASGAVCAWSPLACRYMSEVAPTVAVNLEWALAAIGAGFVFGFFLGWARVSRRLVLRGLSRGYTEIIRGTPLLIQIFAVYYSFPAFNQALQASGVGFRINLSEVQRIVIALVLNTSAYQAEIFRAGFQSVASGQVEAAASIGMTRLLTMRHIILPQSLRIMAPPLTNEYIIMFKDATPLAFVVAVPELVRVSERFGQAMGAVLETYLLTAFVFVLLSLVFAGFLRLIERRFAIPGMGISVRTAG